MFMLFVVKFGTMKVDVLNEAFLSGGNGRVKMKGSLRGGKQTVQHGTVRKMVCGK